MWTLQQLGSLICAGLVVNYCKSAGFVLTTGAVHERRHLSRFLFVWCSALPLALYPLVGPMGTIPTSTILTFFFLGIEDIGARSRALFWCNILMLSRLLDNSSF